MDAISGNVIQYDKKKRKVSSFLRRKEPTEAQIQTTFFQWLSLAFPEIKGVAFAIPNGGSRNAAEGANLKRQGVLKGTPDIMIPIAAKGFHGLFIEFKSKKGKLSVEQAQMIKRLEKNGYLCKVCYDWEPAKLLVLDYIRGTSYVRQ